MLTIKAASEQTAVPVATLRAWERRYGIADPVRTENGYRLYDDRALGEIRAMQALLAAGWAPRQAADEVRRRRTTPAEALMALIADHAGLPGPEALVEAAQRLDEPALAGILDEAFAKASFEHVFEAWLTPALQLIGRAWIEGNLDISGEHLVSAAVMRRLAALYDASGAGGLGPRVLVGLATGCEHEIPALAFAIAARRIGMRATYLGPDLPASAWVSATRDPSVGAVVLSVTTTRDIEATGAVIAAMREARPDLQIAVGGARSDEVDGATVRFSRGVPDAARTLATALATPLLGR